VFSRKGGASVGAAPKHQGSPLIRGQPKMLIQDEMIQKESSVDHRIARVSQTVGGGGVVLDIINTS